MRKPAAEVGRGPGDGTHVGCGEGDGDSTARGDATGVGPDGGHVGYGGSAVDEGKAVGEETGGAGADV